MILCDAHLHSTHPPVLDTRALQDQRQGEGFLLSCAGGPADWQPLLENPGITPYLGIHPEKIDSAWRENLDELEQLMRKNPRAGVGECGLDRRFYKTLPRGLQEEVLRAQIRLAGEYVRPVSLHQVGAPGALADLLTDLKPGIPVMIHGFSDSPEILRRYLNLGLYISLGPGRHWERENFIRTASLIPEDRLLLETDWPYIKGPAPCSSPEPERAPSSLEAYKSCLESHYTLVSGALGIDISRLAGLVKRNGTIFTN